MRPALASVEVIIVLDPSGTPTARLRDPDRVALRDLDVPLPLARALSLMNGRRTTPEIAALVRRGGHEVGDDDVERLAALLERAALLSGTTRSERKRSLVVEFARSEVRAATFAGAAYYGDAGELARYVQSACIDAVPEKLLAGEVRGLVAPHMDLWRAAHGYGHAYAALTRRIPRDVDTIVVLGTCHAGLDAPFCFTKKSFATPLGPLRSDRGLLERAAARSGVDVFGEEYKHKGEHSIEFQIVFLRHLLGERAAEVSIVPILCGLGNAQLAGRDPATDRDVEAVIDALKNELSTRNTLVVAGADLAHVGPRFGDPKPLDARGRARLAARDAASLERLTTRDAAGFFSHVREDVGSRRVCGTGPLYTLLRLLEERPVSGGELLSYTQHVDPQEGSIVSHASLAFTEPAGESA